MKLNIVYGSSDWRARILSNFAPTPFELWGEKFASVEGFWQGLKFPEGSSEQKRVFLMYGREAKFAGKKARKRPGDFFLWKGKEIKIVSLEHWSLMEEAIRAKVNQNPLVKKALIATKGMELYHDTGYPDSKTIPGRVFCSILVKIREELLEEWSQSKSHSKPLGQEMFSYSLPFFMQRSSQPTEI